MGNAEEQAIREDALSGGEAARRAFALLWQKYYRRLSAFAVSYRGLPAAEREDLVSESLIAVFSSMAVYDPGRPLTPWVYRVAANRFADAVRRAGREKTLSIGPSEAGGTSEFAALDPPTPGDHAADRDLAERCRRAIAALPEEDRRIAHLRFYEDLSASEIGRSLGMPAGTVRWRIHAIRRAVAARVGEGI